MILLESNFCKPINLISETAIAMGEIVEKKVEYRVERKSEAERDLEDAADKVKAGAKAVANKADESYRDLKTEYEKEKIKEKLD
jgi:hypothetical protein